MSITAEVIILFIVVLVGALCKKLNYEMKIEPFLLERDIVQF